MSARQLGMGGLGVEMESDASGEGEAIDGGY